MDMIETKALEFAYPAEEGEKPVLALRGVDCLLLERGDVNAGASGRNHGLLHSGARYAVVDPRVRIA